MLLNQNISFILFVSSFHFRYVWSGLLVIFGIFLNVYSKNRASIELWLADQARRLVISLQHRRKHYSSTMSDVWCSRGPCVVYLCFSTPWRYRRLQSDLGYPATGYYRIIIIDLALSWSVRVAKVNLITVTCRPHHPSIAAGLYYLATSPGMSIQSINSYIYS